VLSLDGATSNGYAFCMAAKISPRVEHLVREVAELLPDELAALMEAIRSLPGRPETVAERCAIIRERVASVQGGNVATLSMDEVEQSLRDELDF
jgi:hypothetical protein